ncbi:MAG TPA: DNA primase [Gemmatimonadales bacterium]|jgi:DNA primase
MARIPDEVIEQIRDAADLLEIVQEQLSLKRTGNDWRGPCPFHGGTHRNFAVIPKQNRYYCFVCHATGDVFTWYRERFGMDYPTAVREVARRCGIAIPESTERIGPDPREPLFQACDAVQLWFAAQLRDAPEAETARRYLLQRELSLDTAATLGLGYAPRGGELLAMIKQLGLADDVAVEAGLVVRRDDGSLAPRFRGRLIFPIHDLRGRVVGFGGRILGSGEPKYLNSPETPVFHKGEQLYHLHLAKHAIRKAGVAILVEGYFDVLRVALAGIEHVVAPLGTALTEAQATLLKRFTNEVIILYDSDAPGLRATFRAADVLLAHGVRVRVATLPAGEDPDTLALRGGAAAVEAIVADAIDVLERKVQLLERKGWFGDVRRSREALDRLLPTLRAASDPVTRELYLSRVAERLGIPRETVAAEIAAQRPVAAVAAGTVTRARTPRPDVAARRAGAEIERKLLRLLLLHPLWLTRARDEVGADRFELPACRAIYQALLTLPPDAPIGDAFASLDERARDVWTQLVESEQPGEGFNIDREYTGALEWLAENAEIRAIAAEPDPIIKRRRLNALSADGQNRYTFYVATGARNRSNRGAPPVEE